VRCGAVLVAGESCTSNKLCVTVKAPWRATRDNASKCNIFSVELERQVVTSGTGRQSAYCHAYAGKCAYTTVGGARALVRNSSGCTGMTCKGVRPHGERALARSGTVLCCALAGSLTKTVLCCAGSQN